MAAPAIIPILGVLGYRQHERIVYQPYATNTPTGWSSSPLPDGLALDAATGRIAGAVDAPGVYVFGLTASNSDGDSVPQVFAWAVEATTAYLTSDLTELVVDLVTGAVRSPYEITLPKAADLDPGKPEPVAFSKSADIRIFDIRFERNGANVNLPITAFKTTVKDLEPDGILAESASDAWAQVVTGDVVSYRVAILFTRDELRAALNEHEEEEVTAFIGLTELEWTHTNNLTPTVGPAELRSSSQSFGVLFGREQAVNA